MAFVCTGRVWGYADETAAFIRSLKRLAENVQSRTSHSVFAVTSEEPVFLGTRGFFSKRVINQIEYKIVFDTEKQIPAVEQFLNDLKARMT